MTQQERARLYHAMHKAIMQIRDEQSCVDAWIYYLNEIVKNNHPDAHELGRRLWEQSYAATEDPSTIWRRAQKVIEQKKG